MQSTVYGRTMAEPDKPNILILSLATRGDEKNIYEDLIDDLHGVSNVMRGKTINATLNILHNIPLRAIIVTDKVLADLSPEYEEVLDLIKSYIEYGGLAIFCFMFSNPIVNGKFESFFEFFRLPWKQGKITHDTFEVDQTCTLPIYFRRDSLPHQYNALAMQIQGVRETERLLVPVSQPSAPDNADLPQTAVAVAQICLGTLVYFGGASMNIGSSRLLFALCGLPFRRKPAHLWG
ncbi:hypothetical protein MYU51_011035 [Penicillium brevicompactum]